MDKREMTLVEETYVSLPVNMKKDERYKYELNRVGLNRYLENKEYFQEQIIQSIDRLKKRLPKYSIDLQKFVSDWYELIESNDENKLKNVVLGISPYSREMRQNSPLSVLITNEDIHGVVTQMKTFV
jgi:hypothetical protein